MTLTVTHRAPRQIIAGDSIEFLVAVPADFQSWTGTARLTGPTQMDASSVVTEGADFHVKFNGQGTGAGVIATRLLEAGQYSLTVFASTGTTDRKTIAQYQITVSADASTGTPKQPHCITMLALIERAIQARVSGNGDGGVESYMIDGTSVTKISLEVLERKRKQYAAEVDVLQNPNGQFRRIKFAFGPTGQPVDVRKRFG